MSTPPAPAVPRVETRLTLWDRLGHRAVRWGIGGEKLGPCLKGCCG